MTMFMYWRSVVCWGFVLCTLCDTTCAAHVHSAGSLHENGFGGSDSVLSSGVLLASVALITCGVLIVLLCTDFCQKHSGFKDFDNEAFTDESIGATPAPAEFTMYPPIENTPDSLLVTPIVFEPLPDLTPRIEQRVVGNTYRLRPRLVHEGQERSESVDSLDQIVQNDNVQQKLKLQNLMSSSRHQVPRGQLQYIKEIGNGWFGKVLQGEGHSILPGHKKTKVIIQMLKEDTDTQDQLAFLEEVSPFRDTDHANVLKLLGQCVDTEPFLNVLELCPFGDLKTYLRSHRVAMESFNEKGLPLKFACDMAAGLQALHQEGFIHRDFATRNCLLASDLSVKVGDYGISEETFREDYYTDRHGDAIAIRWLAPESLQVTSEDVFVRRITKQANIWTYGVALWEVLTFGALPYSDLTNSHVLRLVVMEKCVKLHKPDVSLNNLNRLYQLLQLCWSEPENRPSLRELRIMLLHLLSRREDYGTTAFDMKWNQLMPRRSPRPVRAAPPPLSLTTGISTISSMASSTPSVLTGDDFDSSVTGLNASQLGLAGNRGVHGKGGQFQDRPVQPISPVNEMSLEAEFSAANVAAVHGGATEQAVGQTLMSADDLLSPIRADQGDSDVKETPTSMSTPRTARVMPDIVATSALPTAKVTTDFTTSTPKKAERDSEVDVYTTAVGGSTVQSSYEGSQGLSTFLTARTNLSSQSSADRSSSVDLEDRSFMGKKKKVPTATLR